KAAQIARAHVKHIVLGGPHPTAVEHQVFNECPEIDHGISGEGEETIGPYLDWLESSCDSPPPAGVIARGHPLTPRQPTANIDDIPKPARHLLPQHSYRYLFATRPGFATMITSRGCPFRCTFCDKSVSGSRWRARTPSSVVDEMEELVRNHGVGFINIYDDNFTLDRKRVRLICEEILHRELEIEWKCEGRVDGVDPALLRLMRQAGCRTIAYGVESANRKTLELLRKDITVEQTIRAFSDTRSAGLRSLAYIILGSPGESSTDVRRTIRFVKEIDADYVQFSSLTALPGTPLYALGNHGKTSSVLGPVDSETQRETCTSLSEEELDGLMRDAWRQFWIRPKPMFRLARDAVRSGSVMEGWRLGLQMARWSLRTA
ncbi:MAG: radical SAM protein, partial [Myxococcota bacterium]|nr:radical SAM protein [Myxococcota bacterium]